MSRRATTGLLAIAVALLAATIWVLLPHDFAQEAPAELAATPSDGSRPVLAGIARAPRPLREGAGGGVPTSGGSPIATTRDGHGLVRRLRGRLVEHDGRAPEAAWVGFGPSEQKRSGGLGVGAVFKVDPSGAFEVRVRSEEPQTVQAWSTRSQHTVVARDLTVAGLVDLGTLRLNAGEALSGHVIAGRGLGELRAAEIVARRTDPPPGGAPAEEGGVVSDGTSLVTVERRTLTDADGAWSLTGLSPGSYEVEVLRVGGGRLHPNLAEASRRTAETPANDVDIEVACVVLVLSVEDGASQEIEDFEATIADRRGHEDVISSLLEERSPYCGNGWCLAVQANETYDFRVMANGHDDHFGSFDAGSPGKFMQMGLFRLHPQLMGSLALTTSAELASTAGPCEIRLVIPGTERCIHSRTMHIGQPGAPTVIPVPAGRWEALLVEALPPSGRAPAFTLATRQRVEILAHQQAQLSWEPRIGGRCVVLIEGPDDGVRSVTSHLEPSSEPALRSTRQQELRRHNPHGVDAVDPKRGRRRGEHAAVLPAGPVVITVQSEGCRTVRREVVVQATHEIAVSVVLERD